ncbi:MAG: SDR family oxidoreductase [Prochloraceae cyanobacterium]|nr:SDR family oxidoreductase [Prochloraceae cyanobacterium]
MKKVLVTGATGRTGLLVVNKLRQYPREFKVVGLARNEDKVKEIWASTDDFYFGNIKDKTTIEKAISGCDALVILTSAVPQIKGTPAPGARPEFYFADGESPEEIDYYGQKNQIDAAKSAGINHVVLVGSMGGTEETNPLNRVGNGKILIWKRKAEQYLIDSGINYTIIRAGGLLNEPGGKRELLVGKNDELLKNPPDGIRPSIPRADVAELVVRALQIDEAKNKAMDTISRPPSENGENVKIDFVKLFEQTTAGL